MEINMLSVKTENNAGPIGQFLCYLQVIFFKTTVHIVGGTNFTLQCSSIYIIQPIFFPK